MMLAYNSPDPTRVFYIVRARQRRIILRSLRWLRSCASPLRRPRKRSCRRKKEGRSGVWREDCRLSRRPFSPSHAASCARCAGYGELPTGDHAGVWVLHALTEANLGGGIPAFLSLLFAPPPTSLKLLPGCPMSEEGRQQLDTEPGPCGACPPRQAAQARTGRPTEFCPPLYQAYHLRSGEVWKRRARKVPRPRKRSDHDHDTVT